MFSEFRIACRYYRRFFPALGRDLPGLGKGQMIGAILAMAILLLQIHYGVIPHALTRQAILSFAWPYLVLLVLLALISAVKTPLTLDQAREKENAGLRLSVAELKNTIECGRRGGVWCCRGQFIGQLTGPTVCQLTDKAASTSNSAIARSMPPPREPYVASGHLML